MDRTRTKRREFIMLFQVAAGNIQGIFQTLQSWGFADALLPFILIFVIIFAILQKIELFQEGGKPDRKINGIISFTIAALVVIPHITRMYPPETDPITIIQSFLPSTAILILAIFMVLLLLGIIGANLDSTLVKTVGLIALILLAFVIIKSAFPHFAPRWTLDPNTQALLVTLITMGLVGWFIIREPEKKKSWGERMEELFG